MLTSLYCVGINTNGPSFLIM